MGPLMICKALLKSPVPRLEVQEGQGGPSGVNRCVEGVGLMGFLIIHKCLYNICLDKMLLSVITTDSTLCLILEQV